MNHNVVQSPQYKRVKQRPSLCGPTCLEMIFTRRGKEANQLLIAQALGTKVPERLRDEFQGLLAVTQDPLKAGTDLAVFVSPKLQKVAKRYGLTLFSTKYYPQAIKDLPSFFAHHLQLGDDVLVNFPDIYNKSKGGLGHYALVSAQKEATTELCDPWGENDAFYSVPTERLAQGINTVDALGNQRGIIVFSSKPTE